MCKQFDDEEEEICCESCRKNLEKDRPKRPDGTDTISSYYRRLGSSMIRKPNIERVRKGTDN